MACPKLETCNITQKWLTSGWNPPAHFRVEIYRHSILQPNGSTKGGMETNLMHLS